MDSSSTILVVDDDLVINLLLKRVLQKDGYTVIQVMNGAEAIPQFVEHRPQLVLLDAMMPVMDGFAVCAAIRALPQGVHTPILMITGLQDSDSVNHAFEVGATDFVAKPIQMPVLRHRVRRIIQAYRAEESLRDSEYRLNLALEGAALGMWDWNIKTGVIATNHRWATMLGYAPGELGLTLQKWQAMIHPADIDRVKTTVGRLLCGGLEQYEAEFRMLAKDGEWRWISARGRVAERDERGEPTRAAGTHLDITERKRAEQALRDSEERFRLVVASIPDHIYLVEMFDDGTYLNLYNSPNVEKLTGYPPETFEADWTFWPNHVIHPDDRPFTQKKFFDLPNNLDYDAEYRLVRRDGNIIWVSDKARVYAATNSSLIYGVVSDITERKRAEEVQRASQKLVELGTLAAGVAHEINSPLQVITGVSQGLLRRMEENRLEHDYLSQKLNVIHRNGWRCAEIIRSLKAYAHISSTRLETSNLNEIIKDTLLLIEHQLTNWAHIQVVTDLMPDMPPLSCDRNQISQVLINLLTNARDAMPGGGQIIISSRYEPDAAQFVVQVADNGCGMNEAVRAKLFDPFFTTKAVDQGTGLGLSISAGIVKAHSGQITVESEVGAGTVFTLSFPAAPLALQESVASGVGRFDDGPGGVGALGVVDPLPACQPEYALSQQP